MIYVSCLFHIYPSNKKKKGTLFSQSTSSMRCMSLIAAIVFIAMFNYDDRWKATPAGGQLYLKLDIILVKINHIIMLFSEPGNVPGGTQLFSGRVCAGAARISEVWGLRTDIWLWKRGLVNWKFPNLGACELKISKFGGLRAKVWAKIEAV